MEPTWATLETAGGTSVLRLERRFGHRPEKVWKLLTEPGELAHWFPAKVTFDAGLTAGGGIRFHFAAEDIPDSMEIAELDTTGEIVEVDPPKLFVIRWQEDVLRFELVPDGDGCRLLFAHVISDTTGGALAAGRDATGWETCLAGLEARLDGRGFDPPEAIERMEAYLERFGLAQGQLTDTPDGYQIRFVRDMMWRPAERIWTAIAGEGAPPTVGAPTPSRATNDHVPAGRVTEADPPHLLAYDWLHDGVPAGQVRWEIATDPKRGHLLTLTQTVPTHLAHLRSTLLAAWHTHLELTFAAVAGDEQRPWPAHRVAERTRHYDSLLT